MSFKDKIIKEEYLISFKIPTFGNTANVYRNQKSLPKELVGVDLRGIITPKGDVFIWDSEILHDWVVRNPNFLKASKLTKDTRFGKFILFSSTRQVDYDTTTKAYMAQNKITPYDMFPWTKVQKESITDEPEQEEGIDQKETSYILDYSCEKLNEKYHRTGKDVFWFVSTVYDGRIRTQIKDNMYGKDIRYVSPRYSRTLKEGEWRWNSFNQDMLHDLLKMGFKKYVVTEHHGTETFQATLFGHIYKNWFNLTDLKAKRGIIESITDEPEQEEVESTEEVKTLAKKIMEEFEDIKLYGVQNITHTKEGGAMFWFNSDTAYINDEKEEITAIHRFGQRIMPFVIDTNLKHKNYTKVRWGLIFNPLFKILKKYRLYLYVMGPIVFFSSINHNGWVSSRQLKESIVDEPEEEDDESINYKRFLGHKVAIKTDTNEQLQDIINNTGWRLKHAERLRNGPVWISFLGRTITSNNETFMLYCVSDSKGGEKHYRDAGFKLFVHRNKMLHKVTSPVSESITDEPEEEEQEIKNLAGQKIAVIVTSKKDVEKLEKIFKPILIFGSPTTRHEVLSYFMYGMPRQSVYISLYGRPRATPSRDFDGTFYFGTSSKSYGEAGFKIVKMEDLYKL